MGKIIKKGTKGQASAFIPRNKAVRKLQVSLAQFRKLCILLGIYPRQPTSKKLKKSTWYFRKDIVLIDQSELLKVFRKWTTLEKLFNKRVGRADWRAAKRVYEELRGIGEFKNDGINAEYRREIGKVLKHRYPTFPDALSDLDDALSLVSLFASVSSGVCKNLVAPSKLRNCQDLMTNFKNYISKEKCLKKVFVSIKGIYFQAYINSRDVTWIEPHQFTTGTPADVDFRILSTFLDLYVALVGFVNFKLYKDIGEQYPPVSISEPTIEPPTAPITPDPEITRIVQEVSENFVASVPAEAEQDNDESADPDISDKSMDQPNEKSKIFSGLKIYLSRETPFNALYFVILSCGGTPYPPTSAIPHDVTHIISDRPGVQKGIEQGVDISKAARVVPQWIFDCVNWGLVSVEKYLCGQELTVPHLSPFGNGGDLYVPDLGFKDNADKEGISEKNLEEADTEEAEDEEEEADESDNENIEEIDPLIQTEIEAENLKMSVPEYLEMKAMEADKNPDEKDATLSNTKQKPQKQKKRKQTVAEEEKELAKMMMSKKERRLYNQIQFGKKKKEEEARVLTERKKLRTKK